MRRVILIGDSIRIGYQDVVRDELAGEAELWAPEENGGDSRNVLAHLEEWVLSREADVVHLNSGLHDIRRQFGAHQNAVTLPEYKRNVREILERIQQSGGPRPVWATITPVNQRWHHQQKDFDRFEEDVQEYNCVAREVCLELGVPVDNLFEVVMEAGRDSLLAPDGVHFTEGGYRVLGEAVARSIRNCCL